MKTTEQIFNAIGELVGEVKGINNRLDKINGSLEDHDKRIDKNKERLDIATGKATVIGTILGFIGAAIIALLKQ